MIRIGILSGNASNAESIKLVQQFKDFKITGIAQDIDTQNTKNQQYTAEDLVCNSDATYINIQSPSFELVQMVIRKSNHLFLNTIPNFDLDQTKQLINLANEAGTNILLFNPLIFLNKKFQIQKYQNKLKLIHIRLALDSTDFESQLLNLLLFMTAIEKSEVRKSDVFAFEGVKKSSLINLRIQFSSGTVAQIELGEMFTTKQSVIEIFQKDERPASFPIAHLDPKTILTAERNALTHFIKSIVKQTTISISLNELEQALICLGEIKEKLKYFNYTRLN